MAGPVRQCAHPRAAFVERTFAIAIRAVVTGNDDFRHVSFAGKHRITRAAVVALENNQRVIPQAFFIQFIHHPANLVIQGVVIDAAYSASVRVADVRVIDRDIPSACLVKGVYTAR